MANKKHPPKQGPLIANDLVTLFPWLSNNKRELSQFKQLGVCQGSSFIRSKEKKHPVGVVDESAH